MSDRMLVQRHKAATSTSTTPTFTPPARDLTPPQQTTAAPLHHSLSTLRLSRPQAKLTVGQPGDAYEQEADRIAQQVMSMPDSATQQPSQREAMPEEELQMKPSLQRSPDGGFQASSNLESRLSSSQGGGSPLPDEVRSFMEPRFGADFSQVRVHTGIEAVQMNQELNAQAFTHKQDVYFGAGKAPGKDALTAHELTHVVQQTGEAQAKPRTTLPQEQHESETAQAKAIPTLTHKQLLQRACDPSIASCLPQSGKSDEIESSSGVITLPEINIVAVPPASLRSDIGTMNYYRKRNADFMSRADAGETPPDYYLNYGNKYVNRFKTVLRPRLSSTGQAWLDCTLVALQTAIEDQRDANPWVFAEMERGSDKFRDFAYGTHSTAYVDCGVCELPIFDQMKIVSTPDSKDLLSLGGVGQILDSFAMCNAVWFYPRGPELTPQ